MDMFIITANRLDNGIVEYYGGNAVWTPLIESSWVFPSKKNAKEAIVLLSPSCKLTYVGLYFIPVEKENRQIIPITKREEIRAHGPTVNGHGNRE